MTNPTLNSATQAFIQQLQPVFAGDIDGSDAARQVFSTDNSIYQFIPQVVIYPKHIQDLQSIMRLASQDEFKSLVITPRGGGKIGRASCRERVYVLV